MTNVERTDHALGNDAVGVAHQHHLHDGLSYKSEWDITKFADDAAFARGDAFEHVHIDGNLLLNTGINTLLSLLAGGTGTAFNNANARIGVGDGAPVALSGTASVTNGSATVTFSASQSGLTGNYLTFAGDSTNGLYKVASGSGTSWTLVTTYGGTTNATATATELPVEVASQTDLQAATNKTYKAMDASYPTYGTVQQIVFRATFTGTDANFAWQEFSIDNGATANIHLNRKVSAQGTKTSGQTWQISFTITLA